MSGEKTRVKVKAVAKLEKYADGVTEEDIKSGKAKCLETTFSEDILVDPDKETLMKLQSMGVEIPKEIWDKVQ